ncbi:MAG: sigma-54-dependent Fis family transcriptional regulator [Proteobacteria bacterium]|nr:sigma-54-dependent Fis family transcriptional regulator [Pseudomonadota bacterium]
MPETAHVLLIDDDEGVRDVAGFQLRAAGYRVTVCDGGATGIAAFEDDPPDVVVTDLKMPNVDGMAVLEAIARTGTRTPVLMITAFGSVETAVAAMRAGAHDYVTKPFARDAFLMKVERAAEHSRVVRENRDLKRRVEASGKRPMLVASAAMEALMDQVRRVAASDVPILLSGASGTGKELVARELHRRSGRADGPFVAVNCAAIPADLLEAELFGHRRGAFTGATHSRPGRFRAADGGTLLLDEIGDLPLALQPKLLRVLQEQAVEPVGGSGPVPVNVRIVAATHQDLDARVADGSFREDLYYRLAVVPLRVPSLAERPEAVAPLFEFFLGRGAAAEGRRLSLGEDAADALRGRPWPGNVRQLENLARRVALLAPGPVVRAADLPESGTPSAAQEPSEQTLRVDLGATPWRVQLPTEGLPLPELEERIVREALALHRGNKSAAARYLGVPRHVLLYRLEKYGIS